MPIDSADKFVTVAEIADLLKVNQQTVRNWIDAGDLPAVRVGSRRVRIRTSDLDAYLEAASEQQRAGKIADEGDAREALRAALARTQAALGGSQDGELAEALRDLRAAGSRVSRILVRKGT